MKWLKSIKRIHLDLVLPNSIIITKKIKQNKTIKNPMNQIR